MLEELQERATRLISISKDLFGIDVLDRSKRERPKTDLRHVLCYILRKEKYTLCAIADVFGIDHATVHHGVSRVADALKYHYDRQLERTYYKLNKALTPKDRPATIFTNEELLNIWMQASSLSLREIKELMSNYDKLNIY